MYLWDLTTQFFHDMKTRKLRVFLAVSGIAWGTLSVILLLAIGDAFHATSSRAFHGMGDSIVLLWTTRTTKAFAGMKPGRTIEMKSRDVIQMGHDVPEIGLCSPEMTHGDRAVAFEGHRVKAPVAGVVAEYEIMRNMIPVPGGRFLDPLDVDFRRRVIFLGNELKQKLFGDTDAVAQTVFVDERPFTVIGVLQKKIQTSNYSGPDEDRAFIPHVRTAQAKAPVIEPVLIHCGDEPLAESDVLVEAAGGAPDGRALRFEHVFDFAEVYDEDLRQLSRERYKACQEAGYRMRFIK